MTDAERCTNLTALEAVVLLTSPYDTPSRMPSTSGKAAIGGKFIHHAIDSLVERGLVEREESQRIVRCTSDGERIRCALSRLLGFHTRHRL